MIRPSLCVAVAGTWARAGAQVQRAAACRADRRAAQIGKGRTRGQVQGRAEAMGRVLR